MSRPIAALLILALVGSAHAAEVRGRVLDRSGNAIPDAQVTLSTTAGVRTSLTDQTGTFAFPDADGATSVLAVAQGFAPQAIEVSSPSELTITLQAAGAREVVVVTPDRGSAELAQTPASVSVIDQAQLESSGAITLDQKLRVIPGFTLFRRTGSLAANPTAQGVSLRGVGGSGASRALVAKDGIPLNDPFGGWVYWTREPSLAIESVEVVRGGFSHLYGSDALSGVINVRPSEPTTNQLLVDASYGGYNTGDFSLLASGEAKRWRGTFIGEVFDTDGYIQIGSADKGVVDTPAAARFGNAQVKLGREFSGDGRLWLQGSFFNESRENGTPLQTNSTRIADGSAAVSKVIDQNLLRVHVYGSSQRFAQSFSAIAADRDSETLTRTQLVPGQQVGGGAQWSREVDRHSLTAGVDLREVRGVSNETGFFAGNPTTLLSAGGRQRSTGLFAQDNIRLHPRWLATIGGRFDIWENFAASSRSAPVANPSAVSVTDFPNQTENAFSPHVGVVFQATDAFALTASAYGAFRAPTLNELYRAFRVGNVLTLANDSLQAERLYGGEFGGRYLISSSEFTATFFWNETTDPVTNRTLSVTPTLITRQRQNLGQTRARGIELSARHRFTQNLQIGAGYQFVDSTVVSSPASPSLESLQVPQVPQNQLSIFASYAQPQGWTFSFTGRFSSEQFDDDQNLLPLAAFFTADVFAARQINSRVQVYVAAENAFDARYEVGRTPVVSIGPPIIARAGVRLSLNKR